MLSSHRPQPTAIANVKRIDPVPCSFCERAAGAIVSMMHVLNAKDAIERINSWKRLKIVHDLDICVRMFLSIKCEMLDTCLFQI